MAAQPSTSPLAVAGAALAIAGAGVAVAVAEMAGRAGGAGAVVVGVILLFVGLRSGATSPTDTSQRELTDARIRAEDAEAKLGVVRAQAERLAGGDALTAKSEGTALAALYRVQDKMDEMLRARAHIVATERDLDQARRMYRQILPLSSAMEHAGICVAGSSTPAAETGGDWWTYRKVAGGGVMLVIGDATGHGVNSAMVGCAAHGAVKGIATLGEHQLTPRKVLDAVHAAIRIPGMDRAAMTLFTAQLDPATLQLHYMNDGHVFPLVARRDADGVITDVSSIMGDRGDEALSDDSTDFAVRQGSHTLEPGQVLVFFTDGLIERANKDGRQFGARRLSQTLVGAPVPHTLVALQGLRDRILAKVAEFAGDSPLEDDVTLVLCALAPKA